MNQNNEVGHEYSFHEGISIHDQLSTLRLIVKAIFNSTKTSIFLLDPDYKIIFLNKMARDGCQLNYGKEVKPGDCLDDLRIENDESTWKLFRESFEEALQGKPVMNEQQLGLPNTKSWIRMEYTSVFDLGKVVGVVMQCANINERKEHELRIATQSEKLREISWTQSHKTRQPLASILGLLKIVDKESLTKENLEIVNMLEVTAQKLDKVICDTVIKANSLDRLLGKPEV